MKFVEKSGKTVDSAIMDALIELGATTDQVEIEIIDKGSKGIFGLGAKNARVRVALKEKEEIFIKEKKLATNQEISTEKIILQKNILPQESEKYLDKTNDELNGINLIIEGFLVKVLKEMNISAKIEINNDEDDKVHVNIIGDNMGIIIGKRGETLDSLQYLTNIVVNKKRNKYVKVMLDTENYRARREETLTKLAYKLAKKATQTKRNVILEPMNPYDRRIIHAALQNSKTVKTHSEGKEPFRRVVIIPNYQNKTYK